MAQKDIWKYYDDWKVHIENYELLQSICRSFNLMNPLERCTTYYEGSLSNPIAWDLIVPDEYINDVKKQIKEFV